MRTVVPHTTLVFSLLERPTLTSSKSPIVVSCRAACIQCANGINDESWCIASVSEDDYAIVDTLVDNGVSSPHDAMHLIINILR